MIYKIEDNYYVKVGTNFSKVEMVFSDNDVTLKPTNDKLVVREHPNATPINFLGIKNDLIKEHNKKVMKEEKVEEVEPKFNYYNKKNKYSK